jgi:hypothetical protein
MRFFKSFRVIKGLLLVGVVAGFGSEIYGHQGCRQHRADALVRTCVDAALGRSHGGDDEQTWGHGGHRSRWVAERCAAYAREGGAP